MTADDRLLTIARRLVRLRLRSTDVLTGLALARTVGAIGVDQLRDLTLLPYTMQCDALRRLQAHGLAVSSRNPDHVGRGYSNLWQFNWSADPVVRRSA